MGIQLRHRQRCERCEVQNTMTGLRDLLKKRDKFKNEEAENRKLHSAPEVTIIRSDTHTQEILNPPSFNLDSNIAPLRDKGPPQVRLSHSRSPSTASKSSRDSHGERKLSSIFHFRSHSKDRPNSENVPGDLPSIVTGSEVDSDDKEAQWEKRATILAQGSANLALESQRSIPEIPMAKYGPDGELPRSRRGSSSEAGGDDVRSSRSSPTQTYLHTTQDDIQKAIRLHESGGKCLGRTAFRAMLIQLLRFESFNSHVWSACGSQRWKQCAFASTLWSRTTVGFLLLARECTITIPFFSCRMSIQPHTSSFIEPFTDGQVVALGMAGASM